MSNLKNVLNEMKELKGSKFVGAEYTNKQNERSKYVCLVGISYNNWTIKKENALLSLENEDFKSILNGLSEKYPTKNITIEDVQIGVNDLVNSIQKNRDKETASNQSKGQNDAYTSLTNGTRLHNDSKKVQLYGLLISKTVITKGEPKKPVNSGIKVLCKNAISKYLNFSAFITLNIENDETVINITGSTYQM